MDFSAQRVVEMLEDAFLAGFLLEHGFKGVSHYPLEGKTTEEMRVLLRPQFHAWLSSSGRVGDQEGEVLADAHRF